MEEPKSLYEVLGGEAGLRRLVDRFYHHMDTLEETQVIRAMHKDLDDSKEKLFCFLSGWSGGPALFHERYGHPMLRRRHFPFSIGRSERDQWMLCMINAIEDVGLPEPVRTELAVALYRVADHMRNRAETDEQGENGERGE